MRKSNIYGEKTPRAMALGLGGKEVTKRAVAAICAAALVGSMFPVCAFAQADDISDYGAASKTEVVYVKSNGSGKQAGIYVINQFQSDASTEVRDGGDYLSVKNLVDAQPLCAEGVSSFTVGAGQPYLYQGDLDAKTETPWNLAVSYTLDGENVSAESLAGKSGELSMTFSVEPNEACAGEYAKNYLLQVSASFDNLLAWDIDAPDATLAQAMGKTQLSYMVFPGKSAQITVQAQVRDFEFDGWQVVGVPLSLALDIDDSEFDGAAGGLDKLESAGEELNDGAQSLAQGANSLAEAFAALDAGSSNIAASVSALFDVGTNLESGASLLGEGISRQAAELSVASKQVDVDSAQTAYAQAAESYTAAFAGAFAHAFNQAYQEYVLAGMLEDEAEKLAQADAMQAAAKASAAEHAALEKALENLITAQAAKAGYASAAGALSGVLPNCTQLSASVSEYVQTVGLLSSGADEWSAGASEARDGAESLASGSAILAQGTQELEGETQGISRKLVDGVRDKLEDYLNPEFELRDFVNGSSKGVQSVQFVYKTEPVEIADANGEEGAPADERSVVEKFLALFGL